MRREQFDRELEEEMKFHLEQKAEENLQAGMRPDEARYAAERQFGNQTLLREVSREITREVGRIEVYRLAPPVSPVIRSVYGFIERG